MFRIIIKKVVKNLVYIIQHFNNKAFKIVTIHVDQQQYKN